MKIKYNFVIQSSFYMESKNYHEDLSHIRSMMERSSRFISLSGLSGVVAGLAAIFGAAYVCFVLKGKGLIILMETELLSVKVWSMNWSLLEL